MLLFHKIFRTRSAVATLLLCLVVALIVYFWDQNRVKERANDPDGVWTITMDNKETSYTFRGPLDMFLIHYSVVTSHRKLTADVNSLTMQWHYETGQPWRRWERENPKKNKNISRVKLAAKVDTILEGNDPVAIAESVYLDNAINNPNPAVRAKPMGKVWNGTALKFERSYDTHYLIEEREPFDGRVITCSASAWYCSLHGARVNKTLALEQIMIWKEDVANWKQYQDKARSLVQQVIVD